MPAPEKSFLAALQSGLPSILPQFLAKQRWFGGKARTIFSVEVSDVVPFCPNTLRSWLTLVKVNYASGPPETYYVPLIQVSRTLPLQDSEPLLRIHQQDSEEILLRDAMPDQQFLVHLLDAIAQGVSLRGVKGELRAVPTRALESLWQPSQGRLQPSVVTAEQSNSSVVYGQRLVLKLFRRLEQGLNPDLEICSFLTESSSFRNVPPVAGYLEYADGRGTRLSLGLLQGYVANQGDAWQFTLRALAEYYQKARQAGRLAAAENPSRLILPLSEQPIPDVARQRIGSYLDSAALLGRRTAELHMALSSAVASGSQDQDFAPQPFSEAEQRALVNSALDLLTCNFNFLRVHKDGMPDLLRREAEEVLKLEEQARRRFQLLLQLKPSAMLTRVHGDYHLGQVLVTGTDSVITDFVIIDFEGEPARSLAERRKKRSPLQDVAGMLRSFHYASDAPLLGAQAPRPPDEASSLGSWAAYWQGWVSVAFVKAYREVAGRSCFIPTRREELALLLDVYLLEKAIYELGYELNNRPSWVGIPLDGISQLLQNRD
jgi:maltose alpha-D-glucosyltransferase / alpha-amylase